jgi:ABC-2 type transport system permease protein
MSPDQTPDASRTAGDPAVAASTRAAQVPPASPSTAAFSGTPGSPRTAQDAPRVTSGDTPAGMTHAIRGGTTSEVPAGTAHRSQAHGSSAVRPVLRRIWGLMYRHLALYRRSWPRLLELAYWPVLQMCIWGFTANFLIGRIGTAATVAGAALNGGVLLWEVTLRSQMGVSIGFLEEMWSRNLGHIFVSPLHPWEMLVALVAISTLRLLFGLVPAILLAWALYAFNLFALGPVLVLFFANLMVMGWSVSLGVISLILRHGAGAEPLAWSLLFGVAPFSAVFYPVSVLPVPMRAVSYTLPSSHVFEGMRAILLDGVVRWDHLAAAALLNVVWMVGAILLFTRQFHKARVRGALLSIGE